MLAKKRRVAIDIEASGLLDSTTVDYTSSPYKLKEGYKAWCLVERDLDDHSLVHSFVGLNEMKRWAEQFLPSVKLLVAHNGIDFDFLALQALGVISDFQVSFEYGKLDTVNGVNLRIFDTLVASKCLNPDRINGHSLDSWGERVGMPKIDWRAEAVELGLIPANAPRGAEFLQWHPNMLTYCERDTEVTVKVFDKLLAEMGAWDWKYPLWIEHATRFIITKQSHRGFFFDLELAKENVKELDVLMEELRAKVEPHIPPKLMGATKLKAFTPPQKQFKQNGEPNANIIKFAERHGGSIQKYESDWYMVFCDQECKLPYHDPIKTVEPATMKDTTHIKGWLVGLGWNPTMYKERDLTVDTRKVKLSREKYIETCRRYIEQTKESPFLKHRLEEKNCKDIEALEKLLFTHKHDARPMKVYTNPSFTVGVEKEIDPNIEAIAGEFPYVKDITNFLTYAHRRNSILGGGFDPDDVDEDDEFAGKGYMASERILEDGRIPTPADSCGAATSRFKHRLVANIPRATSLYGMKMRAMFGVNREDDCVQLGYDFASLEARIESHFCWEFEEDALKSYCKSLLLEKPADVHSRTAAKISEALGKPFARGPAKNAKYCVPMHTQALTNDGWKYFGQLKIGDRVLGYNTASKREEWTTVEGKVYFDTADVYKISNNSFEVFATAEHRWVTKSGIKTSAELVKSDSILTCSSVVAGVAIDDFESNLDVEYHSTEPVWCITTGLGTWVMKQHGISTITGNCMSYGGQIPRVAKTVGCSIEEAEVIYSAFWEAAKPLKLLAESLKQQWADNGKKFIKAIDGRKLPTRSASALVNTLFQGSGVICAKLTMIEHHRLMQEAELLVDFFRDDYKNKVYAQQLIAYHK